MGDNLKYNEDPKHIEALLRSQEMKLEAGRLGGFFGSAKSASSSISWVAIFMLILSGIIATFCGCKIGIIEYWSIITPIITLMAGYLFGRKSE